MEEEQGETLKTREVSLSFPSEVLKDFKALDKAGTDESINKIKVDGTYLTKSDIFVPEELLKLHKIIYCSFVRKQYIVPNNMLQLYVESLEMSDKDMVLLTKVLSVFSNLEILDFNCGNAQIMWPETFFPKLLDTLRKRTKKISFSIYDIKQGKFKEENFILQHYFISSVSREVLNFDSIIGFHENFEFLKMYYTASIQKNKMYKYQMGAYHGDFAELFEYCQKFVKGFNVST